MERPADYFKGDDAVDWEEDWSDERKLYEAVKIKTEDTFEPVEYKVRVLKHSIRETPSYVQIKFPHFLNATPEFRHVFPCVIASKDVFEILYKRVTEKLAETEKGKYYLQGYQNLGLLEVIETLSAGRQHLALKDIKYKLINLAHRSSNHKHGDDEIIPDIQGDNLDDVLDKLEQYIQKKTDLITTQPKKVICSHCNGLGVTGE